MARTFISGGTGFIAAHIIDQLLRAGHSVVTSVRSDEKGNKVLRNHPDVSKDQLSFVIVEDIAQENAFDKAVVSDPPFDYIIHTSSPFHFNVTDPKKDLLDPAIIGTTGILKATKKYAPSVKRIVVTSSFASIIDPFKGDRPGYTYTEADWDPITLEQAIENPSAGYRGSKTFAEKAAWDFMEKEKPNFDLVTMNPPLVLGPIVPNLQSLDSLNTSNQRVLNILNGSWKDEVGQTGTYLWVDVRDLALAHVRATEVDEAKDKRFFVTAGHFNNAEVAAAVRDNFPEYKDKVPSKDVKGGGYPEGGFYGFDNSRTKKILGLNFRDLQESIVDTVKSLQAEGA